MKQSLIYLIYSSATSTDKSEMNSSLKQLTEMETRQKIEVLSCCIEHFLNFNSIDKKIKKHFLIYFKNFISKIDYFSLKNLPNQALIGLSNAICNVVNCLIKGRVSFSSEYLSFLKVNNFSQEYIISVNNDKNNEILKEILNKIFSLIKTLPSTELISKTISTIKDNFMEIVEKDLKRYLYNPYNQDDSSEVKQKKEYIDFKILFFIMEILLYYDHNQFNEYVVTSTYSTIFSDLLYIYINNYKKIDIIEKKILENQSYKGYKHYLINSFSIFSSLLLDSLVKKTGHINTKSGIAHFNDKIKECYFLSYEYIFILLKVLNVNFFENNPNEYIKYNNTDNILHIEMLIHQIDFYILDINKNNYDSSYITSITEMIDVFSRVLGVCIESILLMNNIKNKEIQFKNELDLKISNSKFSFGEGNIANKLQNPYTTNKKYSNDDDDSNNDFFEFDQIGRSRKSKVDLGKEEEFINKYSCSGDESDEDHQKKGVSNEKVNINSIIDNHLKHVLSIYYSIEKKIYENVYKYMNYFVNVCNIRESSESTPIETIIQYFISQSISYMMTMYDSILMQDIIISSFNEIFISILLNLLRINDIEIQLFENDPSQYALLVEDSLFEQRSSNIKTKTIKFIDTLTYNKEIRFFIINICLDMLGYVIYDIFRFEIGEQMSKNINNLNILICNKEYTESLIFSLYERSFSKNDIIDISLTILTSTSFQLGKSKRIGDRLVEYISIINPYLQKINDEYIITKLFSFYSYLVENLFINTNKKPNKNFFQTISFILIKLKSDNQYKTVNYMALNELYQIIFENSIEEHCRGFISENFNLIIDLILNEKYNYFKYWAKFFSFIKNFFHSVTQYKSLDMNSKVFIPSENGFSLENISYTEILFRFFWEKVEEDLIKIKFQKEKNINMKVNIVKVNNDDAQLEYAFESVRLIPKLELRSIRLSIRCEFFNKILEDTLIYYLESVIESKYEKEIFELLETILLDDQVNINQSIHIGNYIEILNSNFRNIQYYHINTIFLLMKKNPINKIQLKRQSFKANLTNSSFR